MRLSVLIGACLCLGTGLAFGQVKRDFDWIPSGNIDVGNVESENDNSYRSMGEIIKTSLLYSDGTRIGSNLGRRCKEELFTVRIATYRSGSASGSLVVRRTVDSAAAPVELTISIDGQRYGKWSRPRFQGKRRLVDVFYVIPATALMQGSGQHRRMKRQVELKITAEQPYDSYRYDFFITRDWDMMGQSYFGAVVPRRENSSFAKYLNGLVQEGDHRWAEAMTLYKQAERMCADFELARCIRRRIRRCKYFLSAVRVLDTKEQKHFQTHYALGQYCACNGFWNEARAEYTKALQANPTHADATYNLAEAMEYCRLPVEKWAPLMERAGTLYNRTDTNIITVLCAINTYEIPGGPTGRIKRRISKASIDALYRDWHYVEQMVYGASRGALKMQTTYRIYTEKDPPWVMHLGWLWAPPTSSIPVWGMYDHTMAFAEYGSSHTGGIDCGPAWSGCTQIGPTRGWEVMLHEWNHQFDWTCISGEEGRGYPTTHDSDGCGKQPIVNMGCGHRSSMRYYLRPAQYRRIEPSDPNIPKTHIRTWALYGPLEAPVLKGTTGGEVIAELKAKGLATDKEIRQLRDRAKREKKDLAELAKQWFYSSRKMDLLKAAENEADFSPKDKPNAWRNIVNKAGGRVDLNALYPDAAPKSYIYAHTYIFSPDDREVRVWYGYHDGMRVWLNGRVVHEGRYYNVAYYEDPNWVDMLAGHLTLKKGWNRLLCKIERCADRGGYGLSSEKAWGFSVNLVNYDNTPITDLKYQAEPPEGEVNAYKRPEVGKYYRWDDVQDDYLEMLPELTQEDLRKITGISRLTLVKNVFLLAVPAAAVPRGARAITLEQLEEGIGRMSYEGEEVTPVNFLDLPISSQPAGKSSFDAFKARLFRDVALNNFLNFDREGAAALRYIENGKSRDLLLIRPEYMDEYLSLIDDAGSGLPGRIRDRVLGYLFVPAAAYPSTPNRTWRAVIVVKTWLGESYPMDEQDILSVPAIPPAGK